MPDPVTFFDVNPSLSIDVREAQPIIIRIEMHRVKKLLLIFFLLVKPHELISIFLGNHIQQYYRNNTHLCQHKTNRKDAEKIKFLFLQFTKNL